MGSIREDIATKILDDRHYFLTDKIISLVCKRIEGEKLTLIQAGDIEWDSTDLDMRFVDTHPKEVNAILDAQIQHSIDVIKEE